MRFARTSPGSPANVDAVLSLAGELVHAESDARLASARCALLDAVQRIELARTAARGEPDRLFELARGLAAGKWSLVDRFERGGVRYVVARSNPPSAAAMTSLSARERSVIASAARGLSTKEIAFLLGISDTTVRVLFMRAARKSGRKTRAELVEHWRNTERR